MRANTFTFKVGKDERRMIATLADRLDRSQSDAVRFVIREAVRALESDTPTPPATSTAQPQPPQAVKP